MKPIKITSRNELATALLEITAENQSAYVMVVRRTGPFLAIGVFEGTLAYAKCGRAEGREVLAVLGEIAPGDHFMVYPPRPGFVSSEPPDAREVLVALAGWEGAKPALEPSPLGQPMAAASHTGISKNRLFEAVCPVLRQYVGPMTDILCDEVVEATPQVVSRDECLQLLDGLAKHLRDPKKSREFTGAAKDRVKAMFD